MLSAAIALAARRTRTLSASGAIAAVVIGAACTAAGWSWAVVLIVFFATSSALSRIGGHSGKGGIEDVVDKGGERDALQVVANGGVFAFAAVLSVFFPSDGWLAFAAGAIAASTADTWATEVGGRSRSDPVSVTTGRRVPPGTSGGISLNGSAASVAGAALIAFVTFLVGWHSDAVWAAVTGGIAGSLIDSILGAAFQVRRWCDQCKRGTEKAVHGCGTNTRIIGGIRWIDNDVVNMMSTMAGALTGALWLL